MSFSEETAVTEPKEIRTLCRHIFTDGRRCASPALRGPEGPEPFCYHHHSWRKPIKRKSFNPPLGDIFSLPDPEDRSAIQVSIGHILQRICLGEIDNKRAGLLLYGLQIASGNLRPEPKDFTPADPIEKTVEDPEYGTIAPYKEFKTPWSLEKQNELIHQRKVDELKEAVARAREEVVKAKEETARITAECDRTQDLFVKTLERVHELESQLTLPTVQAVADSSPRLTPIRTRLYPKTGGGGVLGQQIRHRPRYAFHGKLPSR